MFKKLLKKNNYYHSAILAVVMHACVFTIVAWHFVQNATVKKVGLQPVMQACIYQAALIKPKTILYTEASTAASQKMIKTTSKKALLKQSSKVTEKNNQQAMLNKPGYNDELLIYLHNTIQKNLQFSENMSDFLKNRQIIVAFKLSPQGVISHLTILKSSGIVGVDQQVIANIKKISPIQANKIHFKTKHYFVIPIHFMS